MILNDYGILTTAENKGNDCPQPRTLDEWDALDAAVRDLEVLRLAATIAAQLEAHETRWPRRAAK